MTIIRVMLGPLSTLKAGECMEWKHPVWKPEFGWIITYALPCPTCGKSFCLAEHQINSDGEVFPSVVCPFNCGFHVFMRIQK